MLSLSDRQLRPKSANTTGLSQRNTITLPLSQLVEWNAGFPFTYPIEALAVVVNTAIPGLFRPVRQEHLYIPKIERFWQLTSTVAAYEKIHLIQDLGDRFGCVELYSLLKKFYNPYDISYDSDTDSICLQLKGHQLQVYVDSARNLTRRLESSDNLVITKADASSYFIDADDDRLFNQMR
jgi:hypothetical protein